MVGIDHVHFPSLNNVDIFDYLGIHPTFRFSIRSMAVLADRAARFIREDMDLDDSDRFRVPQHMTLDIAEEIQRLFRYAIANPRDNIYALLQVRAAEGHVSTWNPWKGPFRPEFSGPIQATEQSQAGANVGETANVDPIKQSTIVEAGAAQRPIVIISDDEDDVEVPVNPPSAVDAPAAQAVVAGQAATSSAAKEQPRSAPAAAQTSTIKQEATTTTSSVAATGQKAPTIQTAGLKTATPSAKKPQAMTQGQPPMMSGGLSCRDPSANTNTPVTPSKRPRPAEEQEDNSAFTLRNVRAAADPGQVVVATVPMLFAEGDQAGLPRHVVVGLINGDGGLRFLALPKDINDNDIGEWDGPSYPMTQEVLERYATYVGRLQDGINHEPGLVRAIVTAAHTNLPIKDWPGRQYSPSPETPSKASKQ